MLKTGIAAPDFSLPDHTGTEVTLSDFEDQWVVLYFYPRADTPGCTTQACGIRDSWDEFNQRSIAVLGISDDPVEDLEKFAEKYDLPFKLLSDEDGGVAETYESYGEKNVFGNTVMGVFRNTYVINPSGEITEAFENVSPDTHAEMLLETIPP